MLSAFVALVCARGKTYEDLNEILRDSNMKVDEKHHIVSSGGSSAIDEDPDAVVNDDEGNNYEVQKKPEAEPKHYATPE